ncbi:hypothetical protein H0A36_05220 [Endozoicomonas sp. SM1973]|uniref:Uncharacterized protein n=1 Tax=Spartinivicinus marinus TaxID=2994442 RepID=A0A853I1S3_9GAMM|nr:hypothetical protein [Spartinivicinus marinus]MCX4029014.1 hypothetical protein [Spartinivicinus marinus]NYZ65402.1 hypothetical protein [Spartinivicinus marinus]
MAVWLITVLLASILIGCIVLLLLNVRTPRYRIERARVKTLFFDIVNGEASEEDWQVFISIPIYNDAQLETIRIRCLQLDEKEFIGGTESSPFFLTETAIDEIRQMLQTLEGDIVFKG